MQSSKNKLFGHEKNPKNKELNFAGKFNPENGITEPQTPHSNELKGIERFPLLDFKHPSPKKDIVFVKDSHDPIRGKSPLSGKKSSIIEFSPKKSRRKISNLHHPSN